MPHMRHTVPVPEPPSEPPATPTLHAMYQQYHVSSVPYPSYGQGIPEVTVTTSEDIPAVPPPSNSPRGVRSAARWMPPPPPMSAARLEQLTRGLRTRTLVETLEPTEPTVLTGNVTVCRECRVPRGTCGTCARCRVCGCICASCSVCSRRIVGRPPHFCHNCHMCSRCDKCRKMPHFIPPNRLGARVGKKLINTLPRLLGIEAEISDWGTLEETNFQHFGYNTAHDWSVQPSEREMVLKPLEGDVFLSAMLELAEAGARARAKTNQTCALHVHVNASDYSYWDIRKLLHVYTRIEPEIYNYLIVPHRRDSPTVVHYCQMLTREHESCARCERYDSQYPRQRRSREPIAAILAEMDTATSTSDLKASLLKMLYNITDPTVQFRDLPTRKGGRYEWCRYVGLNLHAWQYRGTIEFRMKEGTLDAMELIHWPLFCGWLVHAVTGMTEDEARSPKMSLGYLAQTYMPPWVAAYVMNKIKGAN